MVVTGASYGGWMRLLPEVHSGDDAVVIECTSCVARATPHCEGCLVTFLCEREPDRVVVSAEELASLAMLQDAGLLPPLRHIPLLRVPA